MANQTQPFRQHHIKRALQAASAAGLNNPSVRVRLPTGAELHVSGDSKDFAAGGDKHMFGPQSAAKQAAGRTGHATTAGDSGLARGDPKTPAGPSLAMPARPGKNAPLKKGR